MFLSSHEHTFNSSFCSTEYYFEIGTTPVAISCPITGAEYDLDNALKTQPAKQAVRYLRILTTLDVTLASIKPICESDGNTLLLFSTLPVRCGGYCFLGIIL
jgi:hypothetical protein